MNQYHSKYVGARVATRFKTSKMKSPIGIEYSGIRQPKSNQATRFWSLLKLSRLAPVLLVFGLIGFIAGNILKFYPELSRIDFGIPSDVIIVAMTAGLALSILVWRPAVHTAIIGIAIIVVAVYWGITINNSPTWESYSMSKMSEQKRTVYKNSGQQAKPLIAPHIRRRLCLKDGTDSDRIECQKRSGDKHRYTWATL